ncbi:hypothetical protein [Larkinella rosea]|uniref:Uncharacterized protein n=1 Tax=Larkinella rosea TaxID=2025312 RepID=A0A3P1C7X6_9BACT|nr:hypothetical protein [Larkinella rosea]RRB09359.1 hypothetical protein EHT25_00160 [Larkinella rosea]
MKIGERLMKQLNKTYAPSQLITFQISRYDVALKTDEDGNPVLMYIGKANDRGIIRGDQFARRLLKDETGAIIKDHWDHKGKV